MKTPLDSGYPITHDVKLTGERAAFASERQIFDGVVFADGESPLKHSKHIELLHCIFEWKYPLWYCDNVYVTNSTWQHMARAGVWYTNTITVEDTTIGAPKNFRRCSHLTLRNVFLPNADETLWNCNNVTLDHVNIHGDYFAMNTSDITADHMQLTGGYCFDSARNVVIDHAQITTKDAFWNADVLYWGCPCNFICSSQTHYCCRTDCSVISYL